MKVICFFCETEQDTCESTMVVVREDCGEESLDKRPVCRHCRSLAETCAADAL